MVVVVGGTKSSSNLRFRTRERGESSLLYFSVLPAAAAALALLRSNPSTRHSISVSPSSVRVRFVRSNIFPSLAMRSANSTGMKTGLGCPLAFSHLCILL